MIDLEPFVKVKTHEAPKRENWFKRFWRKHVICTCEHPDVCFDCNEGNDSCYNLEKCPTNDAGFTLVELILVIMIIGFLAFAIINLGGAAWLKPVIEFFTFS